jgi:AraC family transcriptional regulator
MLGNTVFSQQLGNVTISKTTYEPNLIMAAHVHDLPYVSLVTQGRYTEHRAGSPRHLYRDMLVFHPAGEVHADCVHDGSMTTVNLEYRAAELPREFICAQGPDVDVLASRFLSALCESGAGLHGSISAISDFLWARARRSQPSERMLLARDVLECGEKNSPVTSLAAELGIHRVHLHRTFKQAYGEAPRAGITKRRLAAAATLLTTTDASIAAVAAECGYYDQSHFCRQFKQFTGISPSQYRSAFAA